MLRWIPLSLRKQQSYFFNSSNCCLVTQSLRVTSLRMSVPAGGYSYFYGANNWMAWCKTGIIDFFGWIFFLQKCRFFACAIIFWLVCTLFLRKTRTKYRNVHNEHNKTEQEHFSQKKIQENVLLLNFTQKSHLSRLAPSHSITPC